MVQRVISTIRHPYTSRQVLSKILAFWGRNRHHPIIIVAKTEDDVSRVIRNIRVTLSKERQRQRRPQGTHYGFTQSPAFPFTEDGKPGVAVVIRWRVTALQNLHNLFDGEEIRKKAHV